jgi:hypothetical protein
VFEKRVLRRISGPKRDERMGCRKLHNENLHNFTLCHKCEIRVIKSRGIIRAGLVARIG